MNTNCGVPGIRGLTGKANVMADALSRKEHEKPKTVRALRTGRSDRDPVQTPVRSWYLARFLKTRPVLAVYGRTGPGEPPGEPVKCNKYDIHAAIPVTIRPLLKLVCLLTFRFSSEVELGKFLGSIDVIPDAYRAISEMNSVYELSTTRSGNNILAFKCSSDYTARFLSGGIDLVSSEGLPVVDFISTKLNPSFSVNEAAVELFQHLGEDLKELENKHKNTSLIITGSGLGGYLAILSTLRLHHAIDVEESNSFNKKTKRPICITFGSPVIGDASFQGAIAERPQWKSRFLNVVAKEDPVASFFSSNTPYRPFGTYLFCTESGGYTTFEDQDSILLVLDAMRLWNACNLQIYDYANVWSSVRKKVLYRGLSEPNEFNLNSLRAGITLQLKEAGVLNDITDDEIGEMEKKQTKMITRKKMVNANVATKKLNDTKICLTYMEWYMKTRKTQGGYYDAYKNPTNDIEKRSCQEVRKIRGTLNAFWKKTVEEKDQIPQKEGTNLRKRWLYGGTTYRRMVEPLDIAEYYRMGKHNYMESRSDHYKLLEKWSDEDKKNSKLSDGKRYRAASLTEDSCFWAHVEEAFISLRDITYEWKASVNIEQKLVEFEAYVMREINNYSVSPDIFLEGSSFMKWWDEYKAHKGNVYASEFAQYMNSKMYESYQ
ncbi:senescence-associated carboxylesterase 101-like [Bidens hawaiensis]|uniref:senescence-associated carboxylesterase 101-like n=1 Tax=Bidens hawaiensis TaxID=980011 RepID=UPI00404B1F93